MDNTILLWTPLGFILFLMSLLINLGNTYRNVKNQKALGGTIDNPVIFFLTNLPILVICFTDSIVIAVGSFFIVGGLSHIFLIIFYKNI